MDDFDFTPTPGSKHLDVIFAELDLRRVLLLDEVPFEPLWAELLARWAGR
jgi:hypothetical protein